MNKIANAGIALGKALAGIHPASAFLTTIYNEYINEQWQERRELWEKTFEEKFKKLEDEIGKDRIRNVSNFASLFASATHAAMTDIDEKKVNYYATSLMNAIKSETLSGTKKHIFLNMLREFTLLHIETLKFFNYPHQIRVGCQTKVTGMRNAYDIVTEIDTKLDIGEGILNVIIADLKSKSLIDISWLDDALGTFGIKKHTTTLGDEFLAFITEQEAKNA